MSLFDKIPDVKKLLDFTALPRHVGIIMDGNGRYAKAHGMPRLFGHRAGVERLHDIVAATSDLGIEAITVYAFSTENWKRPIEEVNGLMKLLIEYLYKEVDELKRNNIKITFMGDKSRMGAKILDAMKYAKESTKHNTGTIFNVAFNYGGRQEIVEAAKKAAMLVKNAEMTVDDINIDTFSELLDSRGLPELDLLIRTSGEQRLSNFMLYQAAYAELVFVTQHWPEFDENAYVAAIAQFQQRARRFGGI